MDKRTGIQILKKSWPYVVAAIIYIFFSNIDILELPEKMMLLDILGILISFVGGLLFFISIFALPILVYRLIRRIPPGRDYIWAVFIGLLFILDMSFVRIFILDISKDRMISKAQPLITAINQYGSDYNRYPENLSELIPEYINTIPKPTSKDWLDYRYKNYDSTYCLSFSQRIAGRTYRAFSYSPTGVIVAPEFAGDIKNLDRNNWQYYYY